MSNYRTLVEEYCADNDLNLVVEYGPVVKYAIYDEISTIRSNLGEMTVICDPSHSGTPGENGTDVDWSLIWRHLDHYARQITVIENFKAAVPEIPEVKV